MPRDQVEPMIYTLGEIARTQAIADALGIKDLASQEEEFWKIQRRVFRARFLNYCQYLLGIDLATQPLEMEPSQCALVIAKARELLDSGFTAKDVRQWFLFQGHVLAKTASDARRERNALAATAICALVFLDDGSRPLYLGGTFSEPTLVENVEGAIKYPVLTSKMTTVSYLQGMAETNTGFIKGLFPELDVASVKFITVKL